MNEAKSAVARPQERKFLGFSFTGGKEPKRRIAPKALLRCKQRVRELTRRTRGISLQQMTKELASYLRWLEELLRLQPDALGAAKAGSMDATQVAIHDLEAMEAQQGAVCSATPAEHRTCPRGSNRRQFPWSMAYCQQSGFVVSVFRLLTSMRSVFRDCGMASRSTELNRRMRDPHVRWCGRFFFFFFFFF